MQSDLDVWTICSQSVQGSTASDQLPVAVINSASEAVMQLFNTRGKEKQLTGGYAMQTRILDGQAQLYESAEFSPKMKKQQHTHEAPKYAKR